MVHFSDKYENILAAVADQNPKAIAVIGIFFTVRKMLANLLRTPSN